VRRANIVPLKRDRKARISEPSQVGAHGVDPSRGAAGDVLDDDPLGLERVNGASKRVPEAASSTAKASSLAGAGNVLAGEAAAEEIDGRKGRIRKIGCIGVPRDGGPVLREHRATVGIDLTLPDGAGHAGAL